MRKRSVAQHTIDHQKHDVQRNEDQNPNIKTLARRRIGTEDDGMDVTLGEVAIALGQQAVEKHAVHHIAHPPQNGLAYFLIVYLL